MVEHQCIMQQVHVLVCKCGYKSHYCPVRKSSLKNRVMWDSSHSWDSTIVANAQLTISSSLLKNNYSQWKMHQNIIKHSFKCFNSLKTLTVPMKAVIGTAITAINEVIGTAIEFQVNTPAFDCKVTTTPQSCRCITESHLENSFQEQSYMRP